MAATDVAGDIPSAIQKLVDEINLLRADVAALRTAYEAHVHSGVTAGAADSAVRKVANAAPALTSKGLSNVV